MYLQMALKYSISVNVLQSLCKRISKCPGKKIISLFLSNPSQKVIWHTEHVFVFVQCVLMFIIS